MIITCLINLGLVCCLIFLLYMCSFAFSDKERSRRRDITVAVILLFLAFCFFGAAEIIINAQDHSVDDDDIAPTYCVVLEKYDDSIIVKTIDRNNVTNKPRTILMKDGTSDINVGDVVNEKGWILIDGAILYDTLSTINITP